jgi:hypothetical protein
MVMTADSSGTSAASAVAEDVHAVRRGEPVRPADPPLLTSVSLLVRRAPLRVEQAGLDRPPPEHGPADARAMPRVQPDRHTA